MSSVKVYRRKYEGQKDRAIVVIDEAWTLYVGDAFVNSQPYELDNVKSMSTHGKADATALVDGRVWGDPVYEWSDE